MGVTVCAGCPSGPVSREIRLGWWCLPIIINDPNFILSYSGHKAMFIFLLIHEVREHYPTHTLSSLSLFPLAIWIAGETCAA